MRLPVVCPETHACEVIDVEEHPLGRLVDSCSRVDLLRHPGACSRACVVALDRRDHDRTEVEVVCASRDDTVVL
jgi:hypothetical protein